MSLSSHLSDLASPIGQFIKRQFGQTARLTKAANQRLKTVETLRPVVSVQGIPTHLLAQPLITAFAMPSPSRRINNW